VSERISAPLIQEKNKDMKFGRSLVAILAVCSAGVILPRTAAADEWDKRTMLTFSQPVEVPGKVLPAGTYLFQLADSSSRHIVHVFGRDGRILATLLTIPTARPTTADDTRMTFEQQRAGAPSSIRKWFYPGDRAGEEFIYSAHTN
jgi:hypothetical protein